MKLSNNPIGQVGVTIFYGFIVAALFFWIGSEIYHHYHNSFISAPNLSPSRGLSSNNVTSTPATGIQANGNTTTQSSNGLDSNGCYTPSTVREYEDTSGCVDFNVGYTYKDNAGTVFIDQLSDYDQGVEVYIPYNAAASDIDYQALDGKNISVTGPISDHNGAPQVTVSELSQIKIYQ